MPKIKKPLTAIEVKRLIKPGKYTVGTVSGLIFQIMPSGSKSWILRTMVEGKRKHYGLGAYPEVGLSQACTKARDLKEGLKGGVDPIIEREAGRAKLRAENAAQIVFRDLAKDYVERKKPEFKPSARKNQVGRLNNQLESYVFPVIGDLRPGDIEISHMLSILKPIWQEKTPTAKRTRKMVEHILDTARVMGLVSNNVAEWKGNLQSLLPDPDKVHKVSHHDALPVAELPGFMVKLQARKTFSARALEFAIYTASRGGEVRQAKWSEIDWDNKVWIVPGDRMKGGWKHRVPLQDVALELLRDMPRLSGTDLIFPQTKKTAKVIKPLSENGMLKVCKDLAGTITQHGFRSTFKDWCRLHTSYSDELSELALAHVNSDATRAAYARDELLELRRPLMKEWADYCLAGIIFGPRRPQQRIQ